MGYTHKTGIFCLAPDRKIPIGYCFDCCCFIFHTSPPGYELGGDESEEAADRRRELLKKVCSQERAVSFNIKLPWSDSTSVRKSILRNWMPLSFLPSTSACYWDPEVAFNQYGSNFPLCALEGEYTAYAAAFLDSCECVHHVSKSTTTSFMISQKYQKVIGPCDCPCDDLVEVKTPLTSVMALSYIAQAIVVTIVGLNMGFRWCVW